MTRWGKTVMRWGETVVRCGEAAMMRCGSTLVVRQYSETG